jgi:L-iditol 2-dehydrogenase
VAQWARAVGAGQVILFDVVPQKLAMAGRLGFSQTFDSRQVNAVEQIAALSGGEGAEVCVEAAGVPATMNQAIAAARMGGRVVLLGNPSADVTLPAKLISQAMRRELDILGTWNSNFSAAGNSDDWRAVLQGVQRGAIDLDSLVTHRVPLEAASQTLEMMRNQREFFAKVLIQPTGNSAATLKP